MRALFLWPALAISPRCFSAAGADSWPSGWMVPWLDRMDRHFDRKGVYDESYLRLRPSEYFRRQCWISFEPIESGIVHPAEQLGPSKLLWATDYPHVDGYFPGAPTTIADKLPADLRRPVLAQGAIEFYKLKTDGAAT